MVRSLYGESHGGGLPAPGVALDRTLRDAIGVRKGATEAAHGSAERRCLVQWPRSAAQVPGRTIEGESVLLQLGQHTIDCTHRTAVMGILNVSHDSPIAASRVDPSAALARARELVAAGAEIIDVGAHSTASAARNVPPEEEIERVCPVIEALAAEGIPASVDTWTASVARAAAEAGVHLLNDVSGFTEPEMVAVAADFGLPAVVMHMRGDVKRHYEADQSYGDVVEEVRGFLLDRVDALQAAGAGDVWLDPGFAFGKSLEDNLRLLNGLSRMVDTGHPVLISASRKGFLAQVLGHAGRQDVEGLLEATIALNTVAAWMGVHVVRVHDVAEIARALSVVNAARQRAAEDALDAGRGV